MKGFNCMKKYFEWSGKAISMSIGASLFFASPNVAVEDRKPMSFSTPSEAVEKLVQALKENNMPRLALLFGPEVKSIIESGDTAYDQKNLQRFIAAFAQKHELKKSHNDTLVLSVGQSRFQFPIPLVKKGGAWQFDLEVGKEEIENRIIGRNELSTIQAALAYVDAQREYFSLNPEKNATPNYAEKFASSEGKRDGLYYPVSEAEKQSPLGELYAAAQISKRFKTDPKSGQRSYHGYHFRILTSQGPEASGGAFDYIVNGKLYGGHALIARPADYGHTGIMTFIVNHDGALFEKDLGEDTAELADAIMIFNPDKTWKRVDTK
jgi:hypothetical protein